MSLNTNAGEQFLTAFRALPPNPRIALYFPGQGSQKVGMGKDISDEFTGARTVFARAGEALDADIAALCFNGPEDVLTDTANAQPAILTTSVAYLAAAMQAGAIRERPAFLAGHSLGQYSALVAAGSLGLEEAVSLVRDRGRLMGEAGKTQPGTMSAVLGLDEQAVEQICSESGAEPANYNGPTQVVIGGTPAAVITAAGLAKERGGKVLPVKVAGAFHTSLMARAAQEFASRLSAVDFSEAAIPVVSNVSASPLSAADGFSQDLAQQVQRPVQWNRTIDFMLKQGVDTFIEIGPGRTLSGLLKRIAPDVQSINLDSTESLLESAGV